MTPGFLLTRQWQDTPQGIRFDFWLSTTGSATGFDSPTKGHFLYPSGGRRTSGIPAGPRRSIDPAAGIENL